MNKLFEDSRAQLISKGKSGASYAPQNQYLGKNRYQRRLHSKVSPSVKQYNEIDMDKFFKQDILDVNIEIRGETDNYFVKIKFGDVLKFIQKEVEKAGKVDLRCVTRALATSFNSDNVYIFCSCLHPSTTIKLLDGTCPTVEELYKRFLSGEPLYAYSTDDVGDFVPGKIEKVFITKTATDFIEVTLDNNEVIYTTPDHLYRLRDGSYMCAEDLTVGQSLMSLHFNYENGLDDQYNHKITSVRKVVLDEIPVYDIKMEGYPNFLLGAGVIVHNCPDFKYRFGHYALVKDLSSVDGQYWSNRGDGLVVTRAAEITNPRDDKGPGCKHIMLVLSNTTWLIKVASVVYNYINYMEKHYERLYQQFIYPAVYGHEIPDDTEVQLDIFDDTLTTDKDTIDTSNKYARTKSQFQKDNEYRFQKEPTEKQFAFDELISDSEN